MARFPRCLMIGQWSGNCQTLPQSGNVVSRSAIARKITDLCTVTEVSANQILPDAIGGTYNDDTPLREARRPRLRTTFS